MKKLLNLWLILAVVIGMGLPAWAETPFNQSELDKFLSDFPVFMQFMAAQGSQIESSSSPETWKAMQIDGKMQAFLSGKGWDTHRFFYVASHVTSGLMAVTVQGRAPEIHAQLEAQKSAILDNPQIPEAMKQQLVAQMQSSMTQTASLASAGDKLPPQEMALIKAQKDRITDTFSKVQ